MKRIGYLAGAVSLLFVGGCATHRVEPSAVALPAQFEVSARTSDSTSGQPAVIGEVDLEHWWRTFDDPAMTALVEEALTRSPDARTARAVLDQARATRASGLLGLLPQGSLTSTGVSSGNSLGNLGPTTRTNAATISWELDLFKEPAAIDVANQSYAEARFQYEATRAALAAQVASSVVQIQGLTQQLSDAEENARITTELLRIARLKADRGLASRSDVSTFESDLATANAQVTLLRENTRAARRTLLVLLGRGADPTDSLTLSDLRYTSPDLPTTIPGDLIARRADVRRAATALAVAAGNERAAQMGFFPTLLLQPVYSKTQGASNWTLTSVLTQPLLSLPQVFTQVKIQSALSRQALIAYEKSVQTAYGEAENAIAAYVADKQRLTQLAQAEASAKQAFDAEQLRYTAGYSDQTALLQKEQLWRQARSALTTLQITTQTDAITAFKALGGGWPTSSYLKAS